MRLTVAAALALAFALSVAGSAAAAPARGQLLLNPDFETPLEGHAWMPADWDTSDSGLASVFFGRDTFLVEGGGHAVGIANVSMLYPLGYNWSQAVVVGREAWGKDAVLTVWTRSNGVQGRGYVLVQAYRDTVTKMAKAWGVPRDEASARLRINKVDDPLLELGMRREYFSEGTTGWVKRTVRVFVPPSVNVLWVRLGMLGTGQVLFDRASLTLEPGRRAPAPPVGTNLLADPGFEGDGNQWEYALPPYENMQVVRDTTVARSGRASIRMEGGLDGMIKVRAGAGQCFSGGGLAGKRVRLSGYLKSDSLKGLAFVTIYAHGVSGPHRAPPTQQYSLDNDWVPVYSEMDIPEDAYEVWVWFVYNAPAEGRLFYDDCSFEVLGPARPKGRKGAPPGP